MALRRHGVTLLLASVWLANGLGAKLLGLVPRHQLIVARFFGTEHALLLTKLIGLAEIGMACWIASGRARRRCAWTQTIVIIGMNSLELWLARDLLLFPNLMPVANVFLLALAFYWSALENQPRRSAERA